MERETAKTAKTISPSNSPKIDRLVENKGSHFNNQTSKVTEAIPLKRFVSHRPTDNFFSKYRKSNVSDLLPILSRVFVHILKRVLTYRRGLLINDIVKTFWSDSGSLQNGVHGWKISPRLTRNSVFVLSICQCFFSWPFFFLNRPSTDPRSRERG